MIPFTGLDSNRHQPLIIISVYEKLYSFYQIIRRGKKLLIALMSPFTFTMRLTVAGSSSTTTATAPPSSRVLELLDEQRPPPPSRVRELLDEQRPQKMMDNMALIIIDQTYSALLEILGPEAPPAGNGHVQISRPVDPADPESPLLSVNASATHCCISLIDSVYGGGGPDYTKATSPKQSSNSQYRLAHATITASPGTLHLARVDGGDRGDYWACSDVRPDVANKGLLGVLETIKARLDAAIRLDDTLLRMAKSSGCRSPKIREVVEVREALEKMRAAVDLDAIMRRRCRRLLIQEEIACRRPDVDQACDADVLAKRLSTLHVGQKRGCPVHEVSYHRLPEPDDAEVLTKKLKALHV